MSRITDVAPVPKSVTLGGRAFPVREARLIDLAELQGWIDRQYPDPLESVWDAVRSPGLTDAQRDRILFDALDSAGEGPPPYTSEEGRKSLATAEGVMTLLSVALRRDSPGLTDEELADAFASMTLAQFARLRRAFYGMDGLREIARMLTDGLPNRATGGESITWGEAIHAVAKANGWTYPEVYALTLTEFRNARNGGEPEETGVVVAPENLQEARRTQHLRYCRAYGLTPDPEITGGGPDEGSTGTGTP